MSIRIETASGLRFYACNERIRLGETASLRFLDPYEHTEFEKIELLFENKTLFKHCRLNNRFFQTCLKRFKITPKSIFLYNIDTENKNIPGVYVIKNYSSSYNILSRPDLLI